MSEHVPVHVHAKIVADIVAERENQHRIWGLQRHSWPEWISILAEEVGEAAERANKIADFDQTIFANLGGGTDELRKELIHVAAVAVAMIEHIDEIRGAK